MVTTRSKTAPKKCAISFKNVKDRMPMHISNAQRRAAFIAYQHNKRIACLAEEQTMIRNLSHLCNNLTILKFRTTIRARYYKSFLPYYRTRIHAIERMAEGPDKLNEMLQFAHELNTWTFTIDDDVLKARYAAYGVDWPGLGSR